MTIVTTEICSIVATVETSTAEAAESFPVKPANFWQTWTLSGVRPYVLDRKKGTWYAVDFEQFGGYSVSQLEMLLKDCNFLELIERPGLWRTGLRLVVFPGMWPEAGRLTEKIFRVT